MKTDILSVMTRKRVVNRLGGVSDLIRRGAQFESRCKKSASRQAESAIRRSAIFLAIWTVARR